MITSTNKIIDNHKKNILNVPKNINITLDIVIITVCNVTVDIEGGLSFKILYVIIATKQKMHMIINDTIGVFDVLNKYALQFIFSILLILLKYFFFKL